MNQETLDFSGVEPAESGSGSYLRPGIYHVKPSAVELVEREGGTAAIKVTFTAVDEEYDGQVVEEKFFLSQKALPRLQYLHKGYLGFNLENKSITFQKLADYLSQKLLTKPKTLLIAVEGKEGKEGKIYGQLPYTGFILEEGEVGAYEIGSPAYIKSIRKDRNPSTSSSAAVLSTATSNKSGLPWEDD